MIEINLLPGTEKRKKRKAGGGGGFSFKMPENLPAFDRLLAFMLVAWVLGPALGLWLYLGVQGDTRDTRAALDRALTDSTRYARLITVQNSLQARQDTIAEKLAIIQEIDAGRFIWPHLLDEISRALPPYTWLQAIDQIGTGPEPTFQIEGRTGSLPALTRYMDALETSPFIRNVQLISSEQAQLGNNPNKIVNNFVLTAAYQTPGLDVIETVPLFEDAAGGVTPPAGGEAGDGASS